MTDLPEGAKFEAVARKIDPGGRLVRVWDLKGGVSARTTALEIALGSGGTRRVIVRQPGPVDRQQNPNAAADEFRLLPGLLSVGIPVSRPCLLDSSGEIFLFPYLVLEYVEGATEFAPSNLDDFLAQFVLNLCRIHALDGSTLDLSFLPGQEELLAEKFSRRPARVDDSLEEGRIRAVMEAVWPLPARNRTVLLHGDYWPGNILWQDGRLKAVIDWSDAWVGDPLSDLASSRLEILWAFGLDAMQDFTKRYQALMGLDCTHLPYWDLYAALRPAFKIAEWAGDPWVEKKMRDGHRVFVAQAFEKVAGLRAGR
jgi:aminoglycoside phosphotransferase (APT) family kinase protein